MISPQQILEENKRRNSTSKMPAGRHSEPSERELAEDFTLWAEWCVKIKPKGGGKPVPFILNRPQRKLVAELENMRRASRPIRLVLLKARQWGGSTCIQLYMAWLQIMHAPGLNSLIIAHQISGSEEIKDMFDRMVRTYKSGCSGDSDDFTPELTIKRVGRSGAAFRLVERDCKITIGTAERPDSSRGGDYNLVHLSEVGLWKKTAGKCPEDIVRSATSGVLLKPMTMIVLESTANGAGTYFHREYLAAKAGESQFNALFIPWFEIESYRLPVENPQKFADELIRERNNPVSSGRTESGEYHWSLWEKGATLEAINWYREERKKFASHGEMASEYPSDDIEAFVHSGDRVFSPEAIDRLRRNVSEPEYIGEIDEISPGCPEFIPASIGPFEIWSMPPANSSHPGFRNRYLVVVDVGGRTLHSDWSVISVFDRIGPSGLPEVAAQWRAHTDFDLLAKKAALIGRFYNDALLVIESNTLETHDRERDIDGLQAPFLLRQLEENYPNLYIRQTPGGGGRPGFHTNAATKPMVISNMVRMVREGLYVEKDGKAIEEIIRYERKPGGSYGACQGCHDDILMTRAIGLHILTYEMDPLKPVLPESHKNYGFHRIRPPQDAFGIF